MGTKFLKLVKSFLVKRQIEIFKNFQFECQAMLFKSHKISKSNFLEIRLD